MSILIKDLKMPKDKPLLIVLNPNGQLFVTHETWFTKHEALELPDHGDLIDRDALCIRGGRNSGKMFFAELLKDAPVIIPAERSEASLCDNCDQRNDKGCCVCKYIKESSEE